MDPSPHLLSVLRLVFFSEFVESLYRTCDFSLIICSGALSFIGMNMELEARPGHLP